MNKEKQKIKIFLVDDHHVFREGIRVLLEQETHLEIVGEASDGGEALEKLDGQQVDVLLLDIDMPGKSGLELIEQLSKIYPFIRVLVFSMHDNDQYIHHMMKQGAKGYILKTCRRDELVRAIETVNNGDSYLSKEVSEKLIQIIVHGGKQSNKRSNIPLTKREVEVIKLVATGRTNQEIGAFLNISHRTVDTHRRNIMEKLNLHNAAALTNYAAKKGLLD